VSAPRILVTGASGFIGGHLARELRTEGAIGASRSAQSDPSIRWAEPFDPADAAAARRALEGIEVLVHAGGRAHVLRETNGDPLRAFRDANVATTRSLVAAARAAGVRRLILLSSISVYGEEHGGTLSESTPVAPTSPYGISRYEAERVALEACATLEVVLLRMPMVYGAGMKGNPLRLFDLVARGVPLPLGSIRNQRSMLYVGNAVAAVRHLTRSAVPTGTVLLAADAGTISTPELVREVAEALGRPARLVPVPPVLLRLVAHAGHALLGVRFPLGPGTLARLASSLVVDSSALERLIGGPLPEGRREGLRAAAHWYRARRVG